MSTARIPMSSRYDAVVVGSGPNGIAAAISLLQAGRSVLLIEKSHHPGGGLKTEALTLPGFSHDVFSAVYPLGFGSPFFEKLPLAQFGLKWIHSPSPFAQTYEDTQGNQKAVLSQLSLEETANALGVDGRNYIALMKPLVDKWDQLKDDILAPLFHWPKRPLPLARFGLQALQSASQLIHCNFSLPETQAFFAGIAAHANIPLTWSGSAAMGLVLGAAGHAGGWPIPQGGAGKLADALIQYFHSLGGELIPDWEISSLKEIPPSSWIFLDITPRQFLKLAKGQLADRSVNCLSRYRYGPAVYKLDWALSGPVPWKARECLQAATVHISGSMNEIFESEKLPHEGKCSSKPFILFCQPSLFDSTRAPAGKHTAWAYCHVPHASPVDFTAIIENQIERFAPGFKNIILKRHVLNPLALEKHNPNLVGGDIAGGLVNLRQIVFRPGGLKSALSPYVTPLKGVYLCSSATPPGPGVHGMCGYHAVQAALRQR